MAQIFPSWANRLPKLLLLALGSGSLLGILAISYFFSPGFTEVGYKPRQPIEFSHRLHAGELEVDCRYCHWTAEISALASVPSTETCQNCHAFVAQNSQLLTPVLQSLELREPLAWARVHRLPDYANFNHSVHLKAGVSCFSCHGDVTQMEVLEQAKPHSMGWCLDCHRNPDPYLRPLESLTDAEWKPSSQHSSWVNDFREREQIEASTDCTACHQ